MAKKSISSGRVVGLNCLSCHAAAECDACRALSKTDADALPFIIRVVVMCVPYGAKSSHKGCAVVACLVQHADGDRDCDYFDLPSAALETVVTAIAVNIPVR